MPPESVIVLAPDGAWGRLKTGAGTPPVRIAEGWFSLYHAVDAVEVDGRYAMTYSAGIVIHDIDQPHIVRYRSPAPVLSPEHPDELHGVVNNVVFPTGIDVKGERDLRRLLRHGRRTHRPRRCRLPPAPQPRSDRRLAYSTSRGRRAVRPGRALRPGTHRGRDRCAASETPASQPAAAQRSHTARMCSAKKS